MLPVFACSSMSSYEPQPGEDQIDTLARHFGSDKQKRMHKYTSAYGVLFEERRLRVTNITEIGIRGGASLQTWLTYFPFAHVHGLDINTPAKPKDREKNVRMLCSAVVKYNLTTGELRTPHEQAADLSRCEHRLHVYRCCDEPQFERAGANKKRYDNARGTANGVGLHNGTMDIVIDDAGVHYASLQQYLFPMFWPLVKPGGFYVIEDVDPQRGGAAYTLNHSSLVPELRSALEDNHVFMLDSSLGTPEELWLPWARRMRHTTTGPPWVRSRAVHNSHLLVIRKRPL